MQYKVVIDVPQSKIAFAEDFFKAISFVKEVIPFAENEITNESVLQSINAYENGTTQPIAVNLEELKQLLCVN